MKDKTTRMNSKQAERKLTKRSLKECSNPENYMPNGEGDQRNSMNDLSWYNRHPNLLKAAASIPFVTKAGMTAEAGRFGVYFDPTSATAPAKRDIPGVCAIHFDYAFGYSDHDSNAPVSIATQELFTRIRDAFSGNLKIDPPDAVLFLMALDQIHAYIAETKRLYRVSAVYSGENYDYTERVWRALTSVNGINLEAFRKARMDVLDQLNIMINSLNQIKFPDFMDLFHRHRWMNEHIYLDEPRANAQTYCFVPNGYFVADVTGDTGTKLVFKSNAPSSGGTQSVNSWLQKGYNMLNDFKKIEDVFTNNGYFKRAFADVPNLYVAELEVGEMQNPVYEAEVLDQIHNLRAVGPVTNQTISQDPTNNSLVVTPTISRPASGEVGYISSYPEPHLDIPMDEPNPGVVAIATRLAPAISSDGYHLYPSTEYVTTLELFTKAIDDAGYFSIPLTSYETICKLPGSTPTEGTAYMVSVKTLFGLNEAVAFKAFPLIWLDLHMSYPNPVDQPQNMLFGSISNFTTTTEQQLRNINRVCVLSEFNCYGKQGTGSQGLSN